MKVLFTHSYFYKMDAKQWQNQMPYLPLGTIYAASLLRANQYEVSLFDVALKDQPSQIQSTLNTENPNILVIYDDGFNYLTKMCLTNMREACFDMIKLAKKTVDMVVVSSSDATDHAALYLENGADCIIYGEGEQTLLELTNSIRQNQKSPRDKVDFEQIDGIIYKNQEQNLIKNKPRQVLKNLDELPIPAWDLIDVASYKKVWENASQPFTMNLATTRGCPFHCNWCAKPIYGQRYNSHSPERVVEMIDLLINKYEVHRFWMCDDIFGLKPNWVQEFNTLVKEKNLDFSYYIQSRADLLLKEDTIEVLSESGLEEVWIGAESGSQKILDAMDKGTTVEQIEISTKKLQKKGVRVGFFIQYGYLGETKEDIQLTIDLIKRMKPDNIGVSVSYPLPGTPFYDKVKHEFDHKTNWKDSDDLAMLFKGTYNQAYYRKLQRYTHKVFRKTQGYQNLIAFLKNPLKTNITKIRSISLLAYYTISSYWDAILLKKMEHQNHA